MLQKELDGGVDGLCLDSLVIVQDECEVVRERGNLIEQDGQDRFNGWEQGDSHKLQGILADLHIQHL